MVFGLLYHDELREYHFGPGHPFRGDRYERFFKFLKENLPEKDSYQTISVDPASDEDLLLICGKDYIDFTRKYYEAAYAGVNPPGDFFKYQSTDNFPIGRPGRIESAARIVVGQAKKACQLVQEGNFQKVVSVGGGLHHAKANYGEGFCLYNDVAFCGIYLMKEYNLDRILILDTDAHAGNGTSDYFYDNPHVLLIDLHQDPSTIYPGVGYSNQIGSGAGKGFTINVPLPLYAGYDSYELVFESIVKPVVQEYKPQIIIRNGGSDPHFADQLTSLGLTIEGFSMLGNKVRQLTEVCDGKVLDLICSGYNEVVLPYAWSALVSRLNGINIYIEEPDFIPPRYRTDQSLTQTERVVAEVRANLKSYWTSLR